MQIIPPDFARTIDLPGVGPCPRPVDIDQSVTGFADLVSLRIYSFADASVINGEAEGDEVLIALLDGAASIAVTGAENADFILTREDIRAIYLPPGHHYRLVPTGKADIAYLRARPNVPKPPRGFAVSTGPVLLSVEDYAEKLQMRLVRLEAGTALAAETEAGTDAERLVHLRGVATSGAGVHAAWETLGLGKGETVTLGAVEGSIEVLVAAAR